MSTVFFVADFAGKEDDWQVVMTSYFDPTFANITKQTDVETNMKHLLSVRVSHLSPVGPKNIAMISMMVLSRIVLVLGVQRGDRDEPKEHVSGSRTNVERLFD